LKSILNLFVLKGIIFESQQSPDFLPIIVISQFNLVTVSAIRSTRWSLQMQLVTEKATLVLYA
jgi:hypothetical protein